MKLASPTNIIFLVYLIIVPGYFLLELSEPKKDPSLFPGHMQPLGVKQPHTEIEMKTEFPEPADFFENYVDKGRPFLVKGAAKRSPAFLKWSDHYLANSEESETAHVSAEPNLKEIRDSEPLTMTFREFVNRYHEEKIYMVDALPNHLRKDVYMPSPLVCNETSELLLDCLTWMSAGGTKSVLHYDDLDNINCLFRGSKELLFIDYYRFKDKVPIDKPRGAYSSLDVDRVNFTKYPDMKDLEYVHCKMEAGDCLFIPWRWYHQVNSKANEDSQNIAVNIWFRHKVGLKPVMCSKNLEDTTLDKFEFKGIDAYQTEVNSNEEENSRWPLIGLFRYLLTKTKFGRANFKTFLSLVRNYPGIFVDDSLQDIEFDNKANELLTEIFQSLNVLKGKFIDNEDLDAIEDEEEKAEMIEDSLGKQFDDVTDHFRTLLREVAVVNGSEEESAFDENQPTDPEVEALPHFQIVADAGLNLDGDTNSLVSETIEREGGLDTKISIDDVNNKDEL